MASSNRVLYGRGLNIAAKFVKTSFSHFQALVRVHKRTDKKDWLWLSSIIFTTLYSYFQKEDGSFVKTGYFMDSLTSIRILNMHRLVPRAIPLIQKMKFLGEILSFRGGNERPSVFNRDIQTPFVNAVFGGCRTFGFSEQGELFGMGENYFSQLGNIQNHEAKFVRIEKINKEKIVDVGCGFQHTLFITESGNLYACGKASDYQIQPKKHAMANQIVEKIEQPQALLQGHKVRKASGGLKFSLAWVEKNRLFAVGNNRFGQCGQNYIKNVEIKEMKEIDFQWQKGEEILDIASGSCHSLVLTNKYVYFFGSIEQGQNPFSSFQENICTPTILPIQNPRKIFANFDRSAIIDSEGNAYFFGGKDYSYCGGESGKLEKLTGFSVQSQIGLGFAHTIIYT